MHIFLPCVPVSNAVTPVPPPKSTFARDPTGLAPLQEELQTKRDKRNTSARPLTQPSPAKPTGLAPLPAELQTKKDKSNISARRLSLSSPAKPTGLAPSQQELKAKSDKSDTSARSLSQTSPAKPTGVASWREELQKTRQKSNTCSSPLNHPSPAKPSGLAPWQQELQTKRDKRQEPTSQCARPERSSSGVQDSRRHDRPQACYVKPGSQISSKSAVDDSETVHCTMPRSMRHRGRSNTVTSPPARQQGQYSGPLPALPKADVPCHVTFNFPSKFLGYLITCNEMTRINAMAMRHNVRVQILQPSAATQGRGDKSNGPSLSLTGQFDDVVQVREGLEQLCAETQQRTIPFHMMQDELLTMVFEMLRTVDSLKLYKAAAAASGKKAVLSSDYAVPAEWEPQDTQLELKEVNSSGDEYHLVQTLLHQSLPSARIHHVERIQNKFLWTRYCQTREMLRQKNGKAVEDKPLFHGTRTTAPEKIFKSEVGFDMRFSAKGIWGEANYFATEANYSNAFAHNLPDGKKQVFLAQVLIGDSVQLKKDRTLRVPPLKPAEYSASFGDIRYDTVNGVTKGTRVYMVYNNCQAYPFYLITYSQGEERECAA
ncbi:uncharacterized protein LOC135820880 isoform X2 [Sycon ciliatum]|uniref:uncharacterized protein LOC135820880 isoform X2 n=1 Tax=Sycon ciliatum TaxID=27933 RepID=UPI0031F61E8A